MQAMTLSEVVRVCVESYLSVQLRPEGMLGRANQVDFVGDSPRYGAIRLELERRREDPVNNVVKAWRQASESLGDPPFMLVQLFSGYYSSRPAKMENARFVGQKMEEWAKATGRRSRYIAVSFSFEPPSGDANPIVSAEMMDELRKEISNGLRNALPLDDESALLPVDSATPLS